MKRYVQIARALRAPLAVALLLGMPLANAAGIVLQNVNYAKGDRKVIVKGILDGYTAGTPVYVRDLNTGTLLGTQITGKQFNFRINVPTSRAVPCAIQVTTDAHAASSVVRNAGRVCGAYSATLTGLVTDEPIPFATVTVTLNGVTYTTVADENGRYSLPIVSARLDELVKIDASAVNEETGEPIEFTNLFGSFARVLDAAAADGSANANVTNVTTASYALLLQANGGQQPATEEELRTAETSIDATLLLELAAVIKLIVDDPNYSLPPGETSLIAFISDPAKVEAYRATVASEDLNAAMAAILADSNLVAGFRPEDIPDRYFVIPNTNPGYIARFGSILEFDAGSSGGRLLNYFPNLTAIAQATNAPFAWSVDDGRLVLEFTPAIVLTSFPTISGSGAFPFLTDAERQRLAEAGISQIRVDFTTLQHAYTRISDGVLVDTVSRETRTEISAPPIPLPDGSTLVLSLLPQFEVGNAQETMRASQDIPPRPFTASCPASAGGVCVPGTWGGLHVFSPGISINNQPIAVAPFGDVQTFATDGSVTGTISGVSANWRVDGDGALVITYPSGWTQKSLVLDSLGLEWGVFSEFANESTGQRYASYGIHVKANAPFVLSDAYLGNPVGTFWQGEINSWLPSSRNPDGTRTLGSYFGWQFYEGSDVVSNVGFLDLRSCDGGPDADDVYANLSRGRWSLAPDGSLVIDRFAFQFPGQTLRTWYPIAATVVGGERQFYVMEMQRTEVLGTMRVNIAPRLNYQREIEAPWVCSN